MRTGTIAFLLGILTVQFFTKLPDLLLALIPLALVPLILLQWRRRRLLLPLLWLTTGFAWALLQAHWGLAARLPASLEGKDVLVEGIISEPPRHEGQISHFNFVTDSIGSGENRQTVRWLLRLKWYGKQRPVLAAGQRWHFTVRLKRPHGLMNPGGFDYEKWLFAQSVAATGYVRSAEGHSLLASKAGYAFWQHWREVLAFKISSALGEHDMSGIVRALAVGDRSGMTVSHWDVLTRTGTNHLVAISGLHIGLVSGFIFFLVLWLVRRSARLCLWQPARVYAACAAIIVALLYAALAGFSVPTQRAFIMVSVFMLGILLRRKLASLDILALAMLLVLLIQPLSVLAAGFWLSFIAVAVILVVLNGRLRPAGRFMQWGAVQWVVSIGLLPLLVMLFGRVSLVAPLANLLAVPWVSFISVPLVMLALPGLLFDNTLVLKLAADSLQWLWLILEKMAALPFASVYLHTVPNWSYVPAVIGIAWLLMPRGMPARWLGIICLLPLILIKPTSPLNGEYSLKVLDVGQGLSVLVQTHEHVLVFDTGARLSPQYDTGSAVILPVLRQQAIHAIDVLMISHGDNDHNGGTQTVLNGIPVRRVISGEPDDIPGEAERCYAGQEWEWDGVRFEVLYPPKDSPLASKTNNRSCVLRIDNGNHAALLTGDIEAIVERKLLNISRYKLPATILLAAHHGSKSSSSEDFIAAVSPKHVVFSVGYRNHYHFPIELIQQRYRLAGSQLYQTDQTGMLSFAIPAMGQLAVSQWRDGQRHYWHAE